MEPPFLLDRLPDDDIDDDEDNSDQTDYSTCVRMDLDDVKALELSAITNELPGNVPFAVQKDLITRSMKPWKASSFSVGSVLYLPQLMSPSKLQSLTDACLDNVSELLKSHLLALVEAHFGYYRFGQFESAVKSVVLKLMDQRLADTKELLISLRQIDESVRTLNAHYLKAYTEKFEAHFKDERRKKKQKLAHEPNQSDDAAQRDQIKSLVEDGNLDAILAVLKQVKQDKQVKELHGFESSLTIMATVRAYFQVAFKRTIDNVPGAIQVKLIDTLNAATIRHALLAEIKASGEGSSERCRRLFQEPHGAVYKRMELLDRKTKLEAASSKVSAF